MKTIIDEILAVGLLLVIVSGCAGHTSRDSTKVQIADEAMVSGCRYLDNVHGASGLYGVFAKRGFENAKADAISEAQEKGATHIVWIPTAQGYGSSQAEGKAYKCGN